MPAIGFKKEFEVELDFGIKRQTIRRFRKRGQPKVGDTLSLYIGMRTPSCKLIRKATCTAVTPITILWNRTVILNGVVLSAREKKLLALADGFVSTKEFLQFFKKTYSLKVDCQEGFEGCVIEWDLGKEYLSLSKILGRKK